MSRHFKELLKSLNVNGRDAAAFAMSLLLAFSIWLIHNLSQNYTEVVHVPVTAKSNISGHSQISINSASVAARCRTRGFDLIRINKTSAREPLVIDFKQEDLHPLGDDKFYIRGSEMDPYVQAIFGKDASLEAMLTDTAVFRFPVENCKKVPVQAVYNASYKSQFTNVGPLDLQPDSILVYGEPFHLDNIDKVYTESFNLSSLDHNIHGEIKLKKIKGVRMSQQSIDYSLEVSRYVEIKATVPISARNVPQGKSLIIFPPTCEVSFICSFPLSADPVESARFYIDYRDFEQSLKGSCIPKIDRLPSGVLNYSIEPEVFDCAERVR